MFRKRVSGVQVKRLFGNPEKNRGRFRGLGSISMADRIPVHRRSIIRRRRTESKNRMSGNPVNRITNSDLLTARTLFGQWQKPFPPHLKCFLKRGIPKINAHIVYPLRGLSVPGPEEPDRGYEMKFRNRK